jgi:hypothetical protein
MKLLSGCEVTCFGEKIWERKQGYGCTRST